MDKFNYEELEKELERATHKRGEDYFVKSHEMLMDARVRRLQFKKDMELGINKQLACMETNPLLEEINPVNSFIDKCCSDIKRKESEQVEHILRNWIDDPITGPITKESLRQRCVRTILYKDHNMMDSKIEQFGNNLTIKVTSLLLGVVQGDYIIGVDGQRSRLTEEQNKRLFEMGV